MLTESHKFVTAHFTNSERTTIEIEWQDPDSGAIEIEYIELNEEDSAYQYLLKFTTLDKIHENTKLKTKEQRETYLATVKYIAEQEGLIFDEKNSNNLIDKLNDLFFSEDEINKEYLFQIKLKAFELNFVKECKDRTIKSKLRKSESVSEIYNVLFEIRSLSLESKD